MPRGAPEDYVMVNERIASFQEKYPEGSLQSDVVELRDDYVAIKAYAYRTPDDPRPGIGHSAMKIPGATPFTRGSEMENTETSAWGRALAALGFEVKRGIASAEEIANKDPSVTINRSEVSGVGRGGRTTKANALQVQRVKVASRDLGLGLGGMVALIDKELGEQLMLPDDEKDAQKALSEYLGDLSSEDITKLLGVMAAALQAKGESAPEAPTGGRRDDDAE